MLWVLYWENKLMVETLGCPNVTEKTFPVSYMHIRSYLEQTQINIYLTLFTMEYAMKFCCFPLFLCIDCWGRLSYLLLLFFGTLHSDGNIFPFLLCFLDRKSVVVHAQNAATQKLMVHVWTVINPTKHSWHMCKLGSRTREPSFILHGSHSLHHQLSTDNHFHTTT